MRYSFLHWCNEGPLRFWLLWDLRLLRPSRLSYRRRKGFRDLISDFWGAARWLAETECDFLVLLTRAVPVLRGIHRLCRGASLGFIRELVLSSVRGFLLLPFHVFHQDVCGGREEGPLKEAEEHVRREQNDGDDDKYVDRL